MNEKGAKRIVMLAAVAASLFAGHCGTEPARIPASEPGDGFPVTFYDVGQGDAALCSHDGCHILVDGGDDAHGDSLAAALRAAGVETLACVIVSHPHDDHYGGLAAVFRAVVVRECLHNGMTGGSERYQAFMRLVRDTLAVADAVVRRGDERTIGGFALSVLYPGSALYAGADSLNDNSIVCRISHDDGIVLFTGDVSAHAESVLVRTEGEELPADVLKVPHHGSGYSSCALFLDAVRPETAVISCGADNRYGHPHAEALARYEAAGIAVRRTDVEGNVTVRAKEVLLP